MWLESSLSRMIEKCVLEMRSKTSTGGSSASSRGVSLVVVQARLAAMWKLTGGLLRLPAELSGRGGSEMGSWAVELLRKMSEKMEVERRSVFFFLRAVSSPTRVSMACTERVRPMYSATRLASASTCGFLMIEQE